MSNRDIIIGHDSTYRIGYLLYLRSETIKKVYDPLYIPDKSFESFRNSKFYNTKAFDYSSYLAECIDKSISYSEYLSESISTNIDYSSYLAERVDKLTSYTQY